MLPNFNPDEPLPAPAVDGAVGGQDTIPGSLQAIHIVLGLHGNSKHVAHVRRKIVIFLKIISNFAVVMYLYVKMIDFPSTRANQLLPYPLI